MLHAGLRLILWGVALLAAQEAAASSEYVALELPATFRGELPCADCVAIRHHLDLWPDGVFHLRRTWLGRPQVDAGAGMSAPVDREAAPAASDGRREEGDFHHDQLGRWRIDAGRGALVLALDGGSPLQFSIEGPRRLRLLDIHGQPIVSALPYTLVSDGTLEPTPLARLFGGELRYLADAARFEECRTGRGYPVAFEAAWSEAERAYLASAEPPGAAVYVTLAGRLEPRPRIDGSGSEPTLIVTRFVAAWPGMRCERARADVALTNTYWRIVRLGGSTVTVADARREPHLILRADDSGRRFSATVGCNRVNGSYTLEPGDSVRFDAAMSTRMACPPSLDATESALLDALGRSARWQVEGATLELRDAAGTPLALLEAVHF
ncbi:MAG: META domain-containing protein [Gammaproteobacteria bacterium]